jgi:curved DNA-binding protein CbpA
MIKYVYYFSFCFPQSIHRVFSLKKKADVFRKVSEAHAVLSDMTKRREYDQTLRAQGFYRQTTNGQTEHPYASDAPDLRARKMYGINEEVWLAHHYGVDTMRRADFPGRHHGIHIVEERIEKEEQRILREQKHYQLHSTAGYFLRRQARLKKQALEEEKKENEEKKNKKIKDEEEDCIIM